MIQDDTEKNSVFRYQFRFDTEKNSVFRYRFRFGTEKNSVFRYQFRISRPHRTETETDRFFRFKSMLGMYEHFGNFFHITEYNELIIGKKPSSFTSEELSRYDLDAFKLDLNLGITEQIIKKIFPLEDHGMKNYLKNGKLKF